MDCTKFTTIKFVKGELELALCANLPHFMNYSHLVDDVYEVELARKTTVCNLPLQIGFFILSVAKKRMLEFKYDFLDVYVDRRLYSILETDTGKTYFCNIFSILKKCHELLCTQSITVYV